MYRGGAAPWTCASRSSASARATPSDMPGPIDRDAQLYCLNHKSIEYFHAVVASEAKQSGAECVRCPRDCFVALWAPPMTDLLNYLANFLVRYTSITECKWGIGLLR